MTRIALLRERLAQWWVVASWWMQGALDRMRRGHLTTDPACRYYFAPRPRSRLDLASRGLACEPCMVRQAFGDHGSHTCLEDAGHDGPHVCGVCGGVDPHPTDQCPPLVPGEDETCTHTPTGPTEREELSGYCRGCGDPASKHDGTFCAAHYSTDPSADHPNGSTK